MRASKPAGVLVDAGAGPGAGWVLSLALVAQESRLLEFCQFGDAAAEDEVRLRAGAVHRFLLLFGALVHHGIEVEVVHHAEGLFDQAAAAESPGGSHDFGGEGFSSSPSGVSSSIILMRLWAYSSSSPSRMKSRAA
jgi:hypothetical protein